MCRASEKAGENCSKAQWERWVILDRRDILFITTSEKARIGVHIEGLSMCPQSGWRFLVKCSTRTDHVEARFWLEIVNL